MGQGRGRRRSQKRERSCALTGLAKRCHIRAADSSQFSAAVAEAAAAATAAATATAAAVAESSIAGVASGASQSNGNNSSGGGRRSSSSNVSQMVHNHLALDPNLSEMNLIKSASRAHSWHWNNLDKSHECIVSNDKLEVCFHPECSESAAAIRGSEPLVRNGNYYYWEVKVFDKTYGTSVMFGLCTKEQSLYANDYCNLVGLDRNGWSLSHKGLIWHNGFVANYTKAFPPNRPVTVGVLFDTMRGELSYFLNGENLGVAFHGLNNVDSDLYPVVGSTAKCTRIRLISAYCGWVSLLRRSCFALIKYARNDKTELLEYLKQQRVPINLFKYISEVCGSQTIITAEPNQYNWNVDHHNQAPSNSDC